MYTVQVRKDTEELSSNKAVKSVATVEELQVCVTQFG